jgi:hypothetical protein
VVARGQRAMAVGSGCGAAGAESAGPYILDALGETGVLTIKNVG